MKKTIIISIFGFLALSVVAVGGFWLGASTQKKAVAPRVEGSGDALAQKKEERSPVHDLSGVIKEIKSSSIVLESQNAEGESSQVEVVIGKETQTLVNIKSDQKDVAAAQAKMKEESAPLNEKLVENEKKIIACPNSLVSSMPTGFSPEANAVPMNDSSETPECAVLRKEHQDLVNELNDIYLKYFKDYKTIEPAKVSDFKVGDRVLVKAKKTEAGTIEDLFGKSKVEASRVESWR